MKFPTTLTILAVLISSVPHASFGADLSDPVTPAKATIRTELNRGHVAAAQCRDFDVVESKPGHTSDVYAGCIDRILSEAAIDNTLTPPFEVAVLFDAFALRATFYDNVRHDKAFGKAALEVVRISGEAALDKVSTILSKTSLTYAQICETTPHNWYDCKTILKYVDAGSWKKQL
ncbi:MAG TPA: hypothetical protein VEU47_04040 [Candidatus Cybelea sp.]|nr:hypothetical protein [Candidatus Cybelea sp.]